MPLYLSEKEGWRPVPIDSDYYYYPTTNQQQHQVVKDEFYDYDDIFNSVYYDIPQEIIPPKEVVDNVSSSVDQLHYFPYQDDRNQVDDFFTPQNLRQPPPPSHVADDRQALAILGLPFGNFAVCHYFQLSKHLFLK